MSSLGLSPRPCGPQTHGRCPRMVPAALPPPRGACSGLAHAGFRGSRVPHSPWLFVAACPVPVPAAGCKCHEGGGSVLFICVCPRHPTAPGTTRVPGWKRGLECRPPSFLLPVCFAGTVGSTSAPQPTCAEPLCPAALAAGSAQLSCVCLSGHGPLRPPDPTGAVVGARRCGTPTSPKGDGRLLHLEAPGMRFTSGVTSWEEAKCGVAASRPGVEGSQVGTERCPQPESRVLTR